jgi:hypothetical protein
MYVSKTNKYFIVYIIIPHNLLISNFHSNTRGSPLVLIENKYTPCLRGCPKLGTSNTFVSLLSKGGCVTVSVTVAHTWTGVSAIASKSLVILGAIPSG